MLLRGFASATLAFALGAGCATGGDLDHENAGPSGRSGASGRGGSGAKAGAASGGVGGASGSGGNYATADGAPTGGSAGSGGVDAAAGGTSSAGSAGAGGGGGIDAGVGGTSTAGAGGSAGTGGAAGTGGTGGAVGTGGAAGAAGTTGKGGAAGTTGTGGTVGSAGAGGASGTGGNAGGAGALGTAGTGGVDAGSDGCISTTEVCNGRDDDCDGTPDDVANPSADCAPRFAAATNVASWQCTSGACAIASCSAGFANCDATASNGCETNTNSDPAHCGNCTTVCSGTTPNCTGGSCTGGSAPTCSPAGFVICDTFEDGVADGWSVNGGTWSVISDGSFVYRGAGGIAYRVSNLADQTVEAKMKIVQFGGTSGSYRAGIVARYTDSSNFYSLQIDPTGNLRVLKGTSTIAGCSDLPSGLSPVTGTWTTLKLSVSGPATDVHIVSSIDGAPKHSCTLTSGGLVSGSAGLTTVGANTQAEFDNFGVWSP